MFVKSNLDVDALSLHRIVDGVLNDVISDLLQPARVTDKILWKYSIFIGILKILVQERMCIQIFRLLLGAFDQDILLKLDLVGEFVLRFEVELKVDPHLLVLSVYFEAESQFFHVLFEIETQVLFNEGSVLKR